MPKHTRIAAALVVVALLGGAAITWHIKRADKPQVIAQASIMTTVFSANSHAVNHSRTYCQQGTMQKASSKSTLSVQNCGKYEVRLTISRRYTNALSGKQFYYKVASKRVSAGNSLNHKFSSGCKGTFRISMQVGKTKLSSGDIELSLS